MSEVPDHGGDRDRARSELAAVVEAEARLDRAIADARAAADAGREAAHRQARAAAADGAHAQDRERTRIVAEVDRAATEEVRAAEAATRARIARYAALRGPALDELVQRLALELVAIAAEDGAP